MPLVRRVVCLVLAAGLLSVPSLGHSHRGAKVAKVQTGLRGRIARRWRSRETHVTNRGQLPARVTKAQRQAQGQRRARLHKALRVTAAVVVPIAIAAGFGIAGGGVAYGALGLVVGGVADLLGAMIWADRGGGSSSW